MPIDGLVSGLDTTSIVKQLMDLERQPRNQMARLADTAKTALESLKSIEASAAKIKDVAAPLQRAAGWNARVATSSDPTVASVTATPIASVGALSFTVDALARGHGLATATNVLGTDTVVAGPSITITQGSTVTNLSVGGGTLAEVAAAINSSRLGLRAATVNTGSGYRLQVDSASTGVNSAFSLDGLAPATGGTAITSQGADARLTFGSGPGAYSVSSASNTFSSIIPGVTAVARALSTSPVVIEVSPDAAGLADKVSALVDAVNATLTEIAARTAYDPATKTAASLTGNSAVRRLGQSLNLAVVEAVSQSALRAPGLAGVSTDRNGKITFDRAKFLNAYQADPTAVSRLFVQGANSTGSAVFAGATDETRAGTAVVSVASLATAGSALGAPPSFGPGSTPLVVRRGTISLPVDLAGATTTEGVRLAIQTAVDGAGLGISATIESGQIRMTAASVGSAPSFEVAWNGTSFNAAAGTDVVGTINGVLATGAGNNLMATSANPGLVGLAIQTDGTTVGPAGTIDYQPGLAQRLTQVLADATAPVSGYLVSAGTNRQARIDSLNTTIAAYDRRLAQREKVLKAQYSALEVTLGRLRSQSNWLSAQLAGANANSSS